MLVKICGEYVNVNEILFIDNLVLTKWCCIHFNVYFKNTDRYTQLVWECCGIDEFNALEIKVNNIRNKLANLHTKDIINLDI